MKKLTPEQNKKFKAMEVARVVGGMVARDVKKGEADADRLRRYVKHYTELVHEFCASLGN